MREHLRRIIPWLFYLELGQRLIYMNTKKGKSITFTKVIKDSKFMVEIKTAPTSEALDDLQCSDRINLNGRDSMIS